MKLSELKIHDGPYTLDEMVAASQHLCNIESAVKACTRILVDGAGREGWIDQDGTLRRGWSYLPPGEETGGIHLYELRNVYKAFNPQIVAEYIESLDSADRLRYIQAFVEKYRPDWLPGFLRQFADFEYLQAKIDADPEGYVQVFGDWSCELRKNPPDEATQEVKQSEL